MPETSPLLGQEVGKSHELPAESKKSHKESRVGSGNWEKRVETGKTKYLSVNEAIMLSSGEKSTITFGWCPKPKPPKIGKNIFERPAIRRKTVSFSFLSHQEPASGLSQLQQPNLQRVGNAEICRKQLQQSTGELICIFLFYSAGGMRLTCIVLCRIRSLCFLKKLAVGWYGW